MVRFAAVDAEAEERLLNQERDKEAATFVLALIYNGLVKEYCQKSVRVFHRGLSSEEFSRRKERLRRIIAMAKEAKTGEDVFLRAQFEQLSFYNIYPSLDIVSSEKAPARFERYLKRMEKTYLAAEERERKIHSSPSPEFEKRIILSAQRFADRLRKVFGLIGVVSEDMAVVELEALVFGNEVDALYLLASPLVETRKSSALLSLREVVRKRESKKTAESVEAIRLRVLPAIDGRVRNYV